MSEKINPINKLLTELDTLIGIRENKIKTIENDYPDPSGGNGGERHIAEQYAAEYSRRIRAVNESFVKENARILEELNSECERLRRKQPQFMKLTGEMLNTEGNVPGMIIQGRIKVKYRDLDIDVPHLTAFPVKEAVKLSSDDDTEAAFSVILRLLYTVPVGKLELYAYDPDYFGATLLRYNKLFTDPNLSPLGKICSKKEELVKILRQLTSYASNLIQTVFTGEYDNWKDYNQAVFKKQTEGSLLPYKMLYLCDVPDEMDAECINMLIRLCNVSERCGIFVAMTVNESHFEEVVKDKWDQNTRDIHKFLESCRTITDVVSDIPQKMTYLQLQYHGEIFPEVKRFDKLVSDYIDKSEEMKLRGNGFFDLFGSRDFFTQNSCKSLDAALGRRTDNAAEAVLNIGNNSPHILIGGTTGSGKSNLLHIMITNLCRRYSPDELNIYLLDFKEGVEFSIYAYPLQIPQAKLVSTEADVEFGLSVFEHICREMTGRYKKFKENNLKDYITYRTAFKDEKMPRIVLLIDEFQVMFGQGMVSTKIVSLMQQIVKQGRAAGIHLVMATQTLSTGTQNNDGFSTLETQFSGRVALKCSASESSKLLGAVSGNDEAAKLTIPFAIMNTQSGLPEYNVKFAIPNADNCVQKAVEQIHNRWKESGGGFDAKIFIGDVSIPHPEPAAFESKGFGFLLGELSSYSQERYYLSLRNKYGNNLLFCGSEEKTLNGLKKSLMLSAEKSTEIKRVIIVGGGSFPKITKETHEFNSLKKLYEFMGGCEGDDIPSGDLIILDNISPSDEAGYTTQTYPPIKLDEGKWLVNYFKEFNSHGSHMAAFFDTPSEFRNSNLTAELMLYIVAFGLTEMDLNSLCGVMTSVNNQFMPRNKAYIFNNKVREGIIKPYVLSDGDDNE